jgi:hypothetical protein
VELQVDHPDYVLLSLRTESPPPGGAPLEIVLTRAGVLQGTILLDEEPLRHQPVSLYIYTHIPGAGSHQSRTNAEGSYRFDRLPPGDAEVTVRLGADEVHRTLEKAAIVEGGRVTELDFSTMSAWSMISGTITGGDGAPVQAEILAVVDTPEGQETHVVETDESGFYALEELPKGTAYLHVKPLDDLGTEASYCLNLEESEWLTHNVDLGIERCALVCSLENAPPELEWQSFMALHGLVDVPRYPEGTDIDYLKKTMAAGEEILGRGVELNDLIAGTYTVAGFAFGREGTGSDKDVINTVIATTTVVELTKPGEVQEVSLRFSE